MSFAGRAQPEYESMEIYWPVGLTHGRNPAVPANRVEIREIFVSAINRTESFKITKFDDGSNSRNEDLYATFLQAKETSI